MWLRLEALGREGAVTLARVHRVPAQWEKTVCSRGFSRGG